MNTWHIDTSVQLRLAEIKREDMIRASEIRQQLHGTQKAPSAITSLRVSLAKTLISLGKAIQPASAAVAGTTPRPAA